MKWLKVSNADEDKCWSILKGFNIELLKELFPEGNADIMNFVLFSTSGIHGNYNTIEETEELVLDEDVLASVTFLVIHPRIICMRYGICFPKTKEDFDFLKKLRKSSHEVIATIGI